MSPPTTPGPPWGQVYAQSVAFWVDVCKGLQALLISMVETTYEEAPVGGVNRQEVVLAVATDCQLACSPLVQVPPGAVIAPADVTVTPKQLQAALGPQTVTVQVQVKPTTVSGDYECELIDAASQATLKKVFIYVIGPAP